MTDINGDIVATYEYDAWGNILGQLGTMASANPYRYAGYRYDEFTGLYYLLARYYDANIGRFINAEYPRLQRDFLRDVVTASSSALGIIIATAIFSWTGPGAVYAGAIGGALGWIIGGSLSRKYINNDLKFQVWIPLVKARTYTIY
ncbi:MAG: RHS repeat-associated core domain-containing protein [Bacillota bacterium]